MLLSIVVPAYNVQRYIKKCIDSCIDKANEAFYEIIVVNDGSKDKTEEILKEYALVNNFSYYNKGNGGLSSARNFGLKMAKGDYIFFLDGDDYLEDNSIDILIKNCKNVSKYDLITFNYYKDNKSAKEVGLENIISFGELTNVNMISTLLFTSDYNKSNWSAWGKLFKKEIITKHNLIFNENNYGSEDLEFILAILPHLKYVYSSKSFIINYRTDNSSSITNNIKSETIISLLQVLKIANETIIGLNLNTETQQIIFNNLSSWYLYCIKRYNFLSVEEKSVFKKYKFLNIILKYSSIKSIKILRIFIKFFGINLTNKLLNNLKR